MVAKSVELVIREKKIGEIVNPKLVQASPEISLEDAVRLMQDNKAGYLIIAKDKKPVGIFTESDVVRKVLGHDIDGSRPVGDFMTGNPMCLKMADTVGKAIDLMGQHRFYHIPLVDDQGRLVNVLSVRTLIRFLAGFYPTEIYNLPPNPQQVMETAEGG